MRIKNVSTLELCHDLLVQFIMATEWPVQLDQTMVRRTVGPQTIDADATMYNQYKTFSLSLSLSLSFSFLLHIRHTF